MSKTIQKVIEKAGGVPALARSLGISDQAVRQWVSAGYIPPKRHLEINALYKVPLGVMLNEYSGKGQPTKTV